MPPAASPSALASPYDRLKSRLAGRADSEHEQAIIRVVIVALLLTLFAALAAGHHLPHSTNYVAAVVAASVYLLVAIVIVAMIVVHPGVSPRRRLVGMVGDFTTMTLLLHFGNEAAAAIYPIYLWIAFGYGFRYGLRYLAAAVAMAFAGFLAVVLTTPFWLEEWPLAAGLLFALIVLPGYTASLIRKLTEAKAQAEAANVAKSRFLASMSHELRTPLNAVIGMSDVLADTPLRSDQREMVHTVKSSGRALLSLIDDILDLTRIEAGRTAVVAELFDLHRELADLLSILHLTAANKGLKLAVQVAPDVPYQLNGDLRHLRQVLLNLAANAVKFTEKGHVLIRIDAIGAAELLSASNEARHRRARSIGLRCSVTDTGIGIPAEQQARIFERFTQADEKVNRRYGGTGLGLAIAKALIHLMGGRIGVNSVVDAGSTFWFDVPVDVDEAPPSPAALIPMTVVVASDDSNLGNTIRRHLHNTPVTIHCRPIGDVVGDGAGSKTIPESDDAPVVFLIDGRGERNDEAVSVAERLAERAPEIACALLTDTAALVAERTPLPFVTAIDVVHLPEQLEGALRATAVLGGAEVEVTAPAHSAAPSALGSILVAEDNPINQKVTRRILEHAGHSVEVVGSGEAALDALERDAFDLLIVDVNMPGISGIDLVKIIRMAAMGSGESLPTIALSADATVETRRECEAAGVDVYLTKPVEARRLLDFIGGLLAAKRDGAQAGASGETVTEISVHPRFRGEASPPIDWQVVAQLHTFGDEAFVTELLEEFAENTASLLAQLELAIETGDSLRFRELVHALRGTAGNVGAVSLARVCRELHGTTQERLANGGELMLLRLRSEFDRFGQDLKHHLAEKQAAGKLHI